MFVLKECGFLCEQQQEDERSDAEEQAATNVGSFELVDGMQVLDSAASSLSLEDIPLPSSVSALLATVHGFHVDRQKIRHDLQSIVEGFI